MKTIFIVLTIHFALLAQSTFPPPSALRCSSGTCTLPTGSNLSVGTTSLDPANGIKGPIVSCAGTPGNTVGPYRSFCMTTTGAAYACKNAAGCTVAADWQTQAGSFSGTAADVPFTQAGTGAAASTVDAKLKATWINVLDFTGVDPTGSANSTTGLQAAITKACLTGETLYFPPGVYKHDGLTVSCNGVILQGAGGGSSNADGLGTNGATRMTVTAGHTGIVLSGAHNSVRDMLLISASSGAGTDDGIRATGPYPYIFQVGAEHFGRDGFRFDSTGPTNVDGWRIEHCRAINNYGDGFAWLSSSDTNTGAASNLDAVTNGGWGFNLDGGAGNMFTNIESTANTAGGVRVNSSYAFILFPYVEASPAPGSTLVLTSSAAYNTIVFGLFGQPTTITNQNNGLSNHISYTGGGINNIHSPGLFWGPYPGATSATTYSFRSGGAAGNGVLSLNDDTNNAQLLSYVASDGYFTFGKDLYRLGKLGLGTIPSTYVLDVRGAGASRLFNFAASSSTSSYLYGVLASNLATSLWVGVEGSASGGSLGTGTSISASVLGPLTATPLEFITAGVMRVSYSGSTGEIRETGTAFANLGTPAAGTRTWCSDCTPKGDLTTACTGSGSGAWAYRTSTPAWVCPF